MLKIRLLLFCMIAPQIFKRRPPRSRRVSISRVVGCPAVCVRHMSFGWASMISLRLIQMLTVQLSCWHSNSSSEIIGCPWASEQVYPNWPCLFKLSLITFDHVYPNFDHVYPDFSMFLQAWMLTRISPLVAQIELHMRCVAVSTLTTVFGIQDIHLNHTARVSYSHVYHNHS